MKKKLSNNTKKILITYGMVVVAYIVVQVLMYFGLVNYQLQGLLVPLCYYSILAVSLNLTVGILGELSLGQAGFACIGVFVGSVFSICLQSSVTIGWLRLLLAVIIGAIVAGIMGLLIGLPVLRLKGDYLAIVTLAFGEIIKNVINVFYVGKDSAGLHFSTTDVASLGLEEDGIVIINGPQGVSGVSRDATFTFGIILLLITLFIVLNIINSRDGRAIMAIRDNTIAAESVGINITKYKLMAFSISAALAGAAGAFYAHNFNNIKAATNNFGYNMSILILVFVVLGGIGNMRGSVIAAVLLTLLPELLRAFANYRLLIYSLVLIGMMLYNWSPAALQFRERVRDKIKKRKEKSGEVQ